MRLEDFVALTIGGFDSPRRGLIDYFPTIVVDEGSFGVRGDRYLVGLFDSLLVGACIGCDSR